MSQDITIFDKVVISKISDNAITSEKICSDVITYSRIAEVDLPDDITLLKILNELQKRDKMAVKQIVTCDRCGKEINYYGISYERFTTRILSFKLHADRYLCSECFNDFLKFMKDKRNN